jgi:RES domain-containing protein
VSSLTVWRLCSATYAATAFDGEGARLYGGRWSPPGISLAYCAESRALAVVEVLANAEEPERLFERAWVFVGADVPSDLIQRPTRMPDNWRQFPHPPATQAFGEAWAREGRTAVVRVPSAVVPGEFNYLINPTHPDFGKITIRPSEPFAFDPRLVS